MTPLPIIPDTSRVAFNWKAGDQTAENVMHFGTVISDPADLFATLDAAVVTNLWGAVSTSARVDSVTITRLDGVTPTAEFTTTGGQWEGGTSGDWSPAAAAVVTFNTAVRGRSYRGRAYLPFLADPSNINGELHNTIQAIMQSAWDAFQSSLGVSAKHVVASYKHSTAQIVNGYAVKTGVATQRRRQTRVSYP